MTNDAKAILLLAGRFGDHPDAAPLTLSEYNKLAGSLRRRELRPADLLAVDCIRDLTAESGLDHERVTKLMKRGVELGLAVENWNSKGIWVLCRSDDEYPGKLKEKLRSRAPAILFGIGELNLLSKGGLAIVGSRNVDEFGEHFTTEVAAWCARHNVQVVSGGARGVDQFAMRSAVDSGGRVVGVLADKLLKSSVAPIARDAIYNGQMVLVSPFHPESGFNVGNAMSRNKLIYALADAGLVVSTDYKKGGTWAGAEEELKRAGKVLVRVTEESPKANEKLLGLGAVKFPTDWQNYDPTSVIAGIEHTQPGGSQQTLAFDSSEAISVSSSGSNSNSPKKPEAVNALESIDTTTVYDAVIPLILAKLNNEMTISDLAAELNVTTAQLKIWLNRAESEGLITKLTRPVRFQVSSLKLTK